MNDNSACPIWGTAASVEPMSGRDGIYVDSPRAGGKYFISRRARRNLENQDERFKARLTSWLIEQRRLGVEYPEITPKTIEQVERRPHLPVHERADRLLRYLGQLERHAGAGINSVTSENDNRFLNMLAWLESTVNTSAISSQRRELQFFLNYLETQGWIETLKFEGRETDHITVEGYAHLAELDKAATDSSQAFVAMWFDESVEDVYQDGIETGIRDAGYKPLIIKQKHHIRKIDDEIIAEIRRSRFLVADFTYKDIQEIENCKDKEELKKVGARGSVYYEAGFAHGLNIPVIFTCRADLVEKVHFDTRQYNHITWEPGKLDEFSKALSDRISAVIGDGPHKEKVNEQGAG